MDPQKMNPAKVVVPVILVALLAAAAWTFLLGGNETKTLTAHFPRTISIYEGSDVRVLGVPVGTVDSVTPSGTDVVVTMVFGPKEVEAVVRGPAGFLATECGGKYWIDLTTSSPELMRTLARDFRDKGGAAVDAPVVDVEQGADDR